MTRSMRSLSAIPPIALVLAMTATARPVRADDASPWDKDTHSQVRLIAGRQAASAKPLRAGIEIVMQPGWKTYWRYPGDSGVPPHFDFAGSENVKAVKVLWPAPTRFSDGGGFSIGYHDHLIVPLHVLPAEAGKPVLLRLELTYALCNNLCVPAEAHAELGLADTGGSEDKALASAEARVPKPTALGANGPLAVRTVHWEAAKPFPHVTVDVAAPAGAPVDLFVEGPTADWALPLPHAQPAPSPGLQRFTFDADGMPPGAKLDGATLTFTLVSGPDAVEVKSHLD